MTCTNDDQPHDDTSGKTSGSSTLSSTLSSSFSSKSFKPRLIQPAGLTRLKSSKVKNSEVSFLNPR